ncbi:hypothetical protein SERLA73DRAFT_183995 [Serpula lacrymans var. lacrymans S7.3]|uniref:Ubiquinol-cytochrome c chaperone domain-containing protein n=2 Tax=Serpula lacrymans var. lacrymans TaxID=341189 RepID=F8Q2A4_SERL3|nr:uncharacterized protein SERLADRAFT_471428 [Serpula lacrymans var. lacrymans S7.9]EGN97315.1 hypothetical protein SERLA73DRAFT_183995 [Serpula lacrymans var. lacrymans S7.3]EGO22902.1 hypothetical protein SERLADRAFT_471428 [Serpula lacrymans var. lacrymans S7.9]
MKIFREQWAGMSLSFDLGLVKGDTEMAAAVWRNLLGARGARGILFDEPSSPSSSSPASASTSYYRRSINLVGGSSSPIRATDSQGLLLSEAQDDNSGVHDFSPGADSDKYVTYPEVMERVIGYVRREVVRMESVEDVDVMGVRRTGREGEGVDALKFGKI